MRLFSCLMLGLGLSVSPAMQAADQKLVSVEITLASQVTNAAPGIRTLYIILHDIKSKTPRPYGAVRVELKADAKGLVYKGDVTTADVQTMGGAPGNIPETFRVKARLDKDGSGGSDQPGDIVGSIPSIPAGGMAKIVLSSVVE